MTLAIGEHTLGCACGLTFLVPRDSSKMNVNNVSHRLLRNLVRPPLNRHLKFPPKIPPLTVKEYVRLWSWYVIRIWYPVELKKKSTLKCLDKCQRYFSKLFSIYVEDTIFFSSNQKLRIAFRFYTLFDVILRNCF